MNRRDLIRRLRWFASCNGIGLRDEYGHPDYRSSRGEAMLAGLLARWLDELPVPHDDAEDFFFHDLPRLIVEAYAELSSDPRWEMARQAYRGETGHDIPDLVDACAGGLHRLLVARSACRLIPLLADNEWLRGALESTFGAQMQVIDHAWRRFVRAAYRQLMPRIAEEPHRGNAGVFGQTTLLTFALAGRVTFTFCRGPRSMTYVADASDPRGSRSGANSPDAPYAECVAMIEDVIAYWDIDKLQRSDTARIE